MWLRFLLARLRTGAPEDHVHAVIAEDLVRLTGAVDLVVARTHGLTPFVATELDQLLRNCGIRTVVAVGNSINIGILGLVLTAVDLGYQVVVPSDAVVGVPVEYGESVMENTISLLATVVPTDDVVDAWS